MYFKGSVLIRSVTSSAEFWSDNIIQLIYIDIISKDGFMKAIHFSIQSKNLRVKTFSKEC